MRTTAVLVMIRWTNVMDGSHYDLSLWVSLPLILLAFAEDLRAVL